MTRRIRRLLGGLLRKPLQQPFRYGSADGHALSQFRPGVEADAELILDRFRTVPWNY
jgi:hypothetical protein